MGLYDYKIGLNVAAEYGDDEFYGVVQGLMRLADTDNLAKLRQAFPAQWDDLQIRYKAPGGLLPGEVDPTA